MEQLPVWQFMVAVGVQLVALVGAYYGLKADNAKLAADLALSMLTERTDRSAGDVSLKADLLGLITTGERHVEDLATRVQRLETGQDEWTKTLRERTHELAGKLQALALKVDRLERPPREHRA
jgi:hypothetical protein